MVGGVGSFVTEQRVLTPGSMYPYAPILFDYIRRTMPMDQPQTLTNDEVYALSAYLLYRNGLIGENDVVNAETLPRSRCRTETASSSMTGRIRVRYGVSPTAPLCEVTSRSNLLLRPVLSHFSGGAGRPSCRAYCQPCCTGRRCAGRALADSSIKTEAAAMIGGLIERIDLPAKEEDGRQTLSIDLEGALARIIVPRSRALRRLKVESVNKETDMRKSRFSEEQIIRVLRG